jgi:hypothetical protein
VLDDAQAELKKQQEALDDPKFKAVTDPLALVQQWEALGVEA